MNKILLNLQKKFPDFVLSKNKSWARLTSLRIGINTPILANPTTIAQLVDLLKYCKIQNIPVSPIGSGSNILGSDCNQNVVIIKLTDGDFIQFKTEQHKHIFVGAGLKINQLVLHASEVNLGGLEPLVPIPATLGGLIRMNAGAGGMEIKDYISEIFGVHSSNGTLWSANKNEIEWKYRNTNIPDDVIITGAILELKQNNEQNTLKLLKNEFLRRKENAPRGLSAGCIFKNPCGISAGKLIDISGCKQLSVGDAIVSDIHANYLLNKKNASEKDFLDLIIAVKQKVFAETGYILENEIRFANIANYEKVKNAVQTPRVTILKGGASNEREISLISGNAVANALRELNYDVDEIDIKRLAIPANLDKTRPVFPVLHGGWGENGKLQELLEKENIKFIGCGSKASSIVIDKLTTKKLLLKNNIKTAKFATITKKNTNIPENLKLPLVIKPPKEGSTVGIFIVKNKKQWDEMLKKAFKFSNELLVEEFIKGIEVTVGVLKNQALPLVEIQYPGEIYDYDAKYEHKNGETKYICPPTSLTKEIEDKAQKIALKICDIVGAKDLIRIDMFITKENDIYVIEANNLPGFTPDSLLPKAAKAAGLNFHSLCAKLFSF